MKKFLVLLLGAVMVLGFSTASFAIHDEASVIESGGAVAEPGTAFVFGGDARVRGWMNKDYDFNSDSDAGEVQKYDQRARFTMDARTAGGVQLRTRITLGSGVDGDEKGASYSWGDRNNNNGNVNRNETVTWDWAYIHIPVGPVTVNVGKQRANWGYKFYVWDNPADRLAISGKFSNVTVAIGTDKVTEATGQNVKYTTATKNEQIGGDYDKYWGLASANVSGWSLNFLYVKYKDARPQARPTDQRCYGPNGAYNGGTGDDSCTNPGHDASGDTYDVFVDGKIGPVGAHAEYVTRDGKLFTQYNGNNGSGLNYDNKPNGGYVAFDYAPGRWVAFAAYAFTKNGYVADNDFAPTLMFGTVQSTAIMNYGQAGAGGTADSSTVVVGGFYNINEQFKVGARYAHAQLKPYYLGSYTGNTKDPGYCDGNCDKGLIQEVDVQADYALTKNLTYTIAYGSADLSGDLFKKNSDLGLANDADNPSTLINMVNYQF